MLSREVRAFFVVLISVLTRSAAVHGPAKPLTILLGQRTGACVRSSTSLKVIRFAAQGIWDMLPLVMSVAGVPDGAGSRVVLCNHVMVADSAPCIQNGHGK